MTELQRILIPFKKYKISPTLPFFFSPFILFTVLGTIDLNLDACVYSFCVLFQMSVFLTYFSHIKG